MKIEEIMSKDPMCCTPEDDVEIAADIMRRLDTGIVPVTKDLSQPSRLLGVVTDRDLCLGVVATGKERTSIRVAELMASKPVVCRPSETVRQALARMKRAKLRRLPVVNRAFEVVGIVSLADIVRHQAVTKADLYEAMAAICAPAKTMNTPSRKAA